MTPKKLRKIKTTNMKKYTYNIKAPAAETQAPDSTTSVESASPSTGTQTPGSSSTPSQATASPSATATSTPVNTSPATPTPAATQPATTQPVTTPGDSGYIGDDADSDYVAPTRAVWDDDDTEIAGVESETTEVTIPTEAPSKKIKADNYEISKKNKLTITAPGTYVIQTKSTETATDGLIEVDYADDTVTGTTHLILNGVNLTSSNTPNQLPTPD